PSVPSSLHSPYLHSFPTRRSSDLSMYRTCSVSGTTAPSDLLRDLKSPSKSPPSDRRLQAQSGLRRKNSSSSRCRKRSGRYHHVEDRKSTRLNSSHLGISYAVFCLK